MGFRAQEEFWIFWGRALQRQVVGSRSPELVEQGYDPPNAWLTLMLDMIAPVIMVGSAGLEPATSCL